MQIMEGDNAYSILLIIAWGTINPTKAIGPANAVVAPHNSTPANAAIALTFLLFIPKLVANSSPNAKVFNEDDK